VTLSVPVLLLIVAGVLAFADLVRSEARSLSAWGVLLTVIALLWGPRL
jgi:uncharacterized membrane protein